MAGSPADEPAVAPRDPGTDRALRAARKARGSRIERPCGAARGFRFRRASGARVRCADAARAARTRESGRRPLPAGEAGDASRRTGRDARRGGAGRRDAARRDRRDTGGAPGRILPRPSADVRSRTRAGCGAARVATALRSRRRASGRIPARRGPSLDRARCRSEGGAFPAARRRSGDSAGPARRTRLALDATGYLRRAVARRTAAGRSRARTCAPRGGRGGEGGAAPRPDVHGATGAIPRTPVRRALASDAAPGRATAGLRAPGRRRDRGAEAEARAGRRVPHAGLQCAAAAADPAVLPAGAAADRNPADTTAAHGCHVARPGG
jgi:hypothetical protein